MNLEPSSQLNLYAIDNYLLDLSKLYSNNKNLDYAYYLLAICYYESIEDEKKDLNYLLDSKKNFQIQ